MQRLSSDEIRAKWLAFFKSHNHHILPSASLVPVNDKSLLWINSGVATLKPYFDGRLNPPSTRIANAQKALRTSDIENVGYTARHQTFFEMLGNFSIGDYFKAEAIEMAWSFLTGKKWLALDPDKLYITIYKNDHEAEALWLKAGVKPDHLIKGSKETNFWDMGQGPCGPNTEIYYDRGEKYDFKHQGLSLLINDDPNNERYLEIWNIVFSQFNNDGNGHYEDLPRKNIDTGAGLERIASVLQSTPTNFETDLFWPIIGAIQTKTSYRYDQNDFFHPQPEQSAINTAFKVIADHVRAVTFAIADGVFPSNKDRGYVLRRLIRRAMVYAHELGITEPFLYQLVDVVIKIMGNFYTHLQAQATIVKAAIKREEQQFLTTLRTGRKILREILATKNQVSGEDAFLLFDSYGFPLELTAEMAKKAKVKLDVAGFNQALQEHQKESQQAQAEIKGMNLQSKVLLKLPSASTFIGYDASAIATAKIIALVVKEQMVKKVTDQEAIIVLDQTPFYAEKGGQAADHGQIKALNGSAKITDVQSGPAQQHLHHGKISGTLKVGDEVTATIDIKKRYLTRKNHSGTHLLHAALRHVLGNHVMQLGSYNNDHYLRLDFAHPETVTDQQLLAIEQQVAEWITDQTICETIYCTFEQAQAMHALAFFGEKYPSTVRVIKFGNYSLELCGGTHVHNSKDVEQLLITKIESKGTGTLRAHALTSEATIMAFLDTEMNAINEQVQTISEFYQTTKGLLANKTIDKLIVMINELPLTVAGWRTAKTQLPILKQHLKDYKKQYQAVADEEAVKLWANLKPTTVAGDYQLLLVATHDASERQLKLTADQYRAQYKNLVFVALNTKNNQKTSVIVAVSQVVADRSWPANKLLTALLAPVNGRGGGSQLLAQGAVETVLKPDPFKSTIIKQLSK